MSRRCITPRNEERHHEPAASGHLPGAIEAAPSSGLLVSKQNLGDRGIGNGGFGQVSVGRTGLFNPRNVLKPSSPKVVAKHIAVCRTLLI